MVKQKLNPKILFKLEYIYSDRKKGSLQARLSQISNKQGITLGAAAEVMAKQRKRTVNSLLDEEDRKCLRNTSIKIIEIKNNSNSKKSIKIKIFVSYETKNKFLKAHIDEINRCYNAQGYTASFILIRKIIENLITEIIKKKFPKKTKENKELYLNFSTGHIRDLSEIIRNLKERLSDFDPDEKKLIQKILSLSENFKNDANDKTHSLYHLAKKKELDDADPQQILDLISEFFNNY